MSSKRNPKGCTSFRCVEEAMQKCNCKGIAFFILATLVAEPPPANFVVERAYESFTRFKMLGFVGSPKYEIPEHVLRFAEQVHASKHPIQLVNEHRATLVASVA